MRLLDFHSIHYDVSPLLDFSIHIPYTDAFVDGQNTDLVEPSPLSQREAKHHSMDLPSPIVRQKV